MNKPPIRRSQADRSASTISRVLDAASDVLADKGYQGTTTTRVAERAGLSRGAILHHFPTRSVLLLAAAERLLEEEVTAFRRAIDAIPEGVDRHHAAIDFLWQGAKGNRHRAWTELSFGARSDSDVADAAAEFSRHMHERITQVWIDAFPEAQDVLVAGLAPDFATALLDGVAHRLLIGAVSPQRATELVDALKALSTLFFNPEGDTQ
jgi:AcrR family transcriptional regulator